MEKQNFKQFAIYSRKSKFTGKGESIENQIELCREYITKHYSEEEAKAALVYEDEGFSGGTLQRPEFKKMMQDSFKTKFAAIDSMVPPRRMMPSTLRAPISIISPLIRPL